MAEFHFKCAYLSEYRGERVSMFEVNSLFVVMFKEGKIEDML